MKLVESIQYPKLLTEEKINSFCRLQFPKFSVLDVIDILKYCSDWNSGSDDCIFEYTPDDPEMIQNFKNVIHKINSKTVGEIKYTANARFDFYNFLKKIKTEASFNISLNDHLKQVELAVKKPKYKDFKLESPGIVVFKGPSTLAFDFYIYEYQRILNKVGSNPFISMVQYEPGTPITIHTKFPQLLKIFTSVGMPENEALDLIQQHFEFTHPLTPKMKWMLNVGYKTLGPQAGKQQVQDDYTLDAMPDKTKPETMKSKSGKPLKSGDMIRVKGETFKYDTDQYFMVAVNANGSKQSQLPLELRDGKFYAFDMATKKFSKEIEGSPSDVPKENILKKPPQKGNPAGPDGKKIQGKTVLFRQDGTPFELGQIFVVSGKNDFVYVPDPDPHFNSSAEFTDYLKNSDVMDRIQTFERIRRKELSQLRTVKQEILDKAADEEWPKDKLKQELAKAEANTKDKWKIGFELETVKSFNEIKKYIKTADDILKELDQDPDDEDDPYAKVIESDPSYGNDCATRRKKLFTAAQKRGATIIKTTKWTAAVCKDVKEVAVFGRLKPKVKPGTNEIDPLCNLEDDEGITPENKAKRDDKECINTKIVQDNIDDGYGHSFNQLDGNQYAKYAKFAETEWCVCGAEQGAVHWGTQGALNFWNTYTNTGKHVMVALMDNTRGALYLYAKYNDISNKNKIVIDFLNENECIDGHTRGGDRSHEAQTKFFNDKCKEEPELGDLMRRIDRIYYPEFQPIDAKKTNAVLKKLIITPKEKLGNACATRRLKLFKAAEHEGAEIYQTAAWVYAVCKTPAQVHPFGRNKPVVIPGTNDIDPLCNMEDWEKIDGKGITPENKAKRDDKSKDYPRVKDGILTETGINLDEHKAYSGQSTHGVYNAEANWCVCGTLHGHYQWPMGSFKGYGSYFNEQHPAIIFMEASTGRMYLYCNNNVEEFKNELDLIDTKTGICDSKQWLYSEFYKTHPEFAVLHAQLLKKYYNMNTNAAAVQKQIPTDPEELMKLAKEEGKINSNGFLIISSRAEAEKYGPILNNFYGIYVASENAQNMFENLDLGIVEVIDMGIVESAYGMFKNATLGSVRLVNSGNMVIMDEMFNGARIAGITEIDTSRTRTMQKFISGAITEKNAMLSIPTLNLKNCLDISEAFSHTNVQKVNLINVQRIKIAKDAYQNCPFLASYPETCFPQIKDLSKLTSGYKYEDIFKGCTTLISASRRRKITGQTPEDENKKKGMYDQEVAKIESGLSKYELDDRKIKLSRKIRGEYAFDFMDMVRHTQDYYEQGIGTTDAIEIDENDMIVVRTIYDVEAACRHMIKHAGVKVDVEDASFLFSRTSDPLYIGILDISKVRDAESMFENTDIQRLDVVVGAENIEICNRMFCGSSIGIMPAMDFKNAKYAELIFEGTQLVELPKNVRFNFNNIDNNKSNDIQIEPVKYIFGQDYSGSTAAARIGASRMKEYIDKMVIAAVCDQYAKDDSELDENGFMLIECNQDISGLLTMFNEVNEARKQAKLKEIAGFKLKPDVDDVLGYNQGAFSGLQLPNFEMPPIDVSELESAEKLFAGSIIKSIKTIIGLENIKNAGGMFQDSNIGELPAEMNFANVHNANSIFSDVKVAKKIKFENIKFSDKLKKASNMFYNSNIFEGTAILSDSMPMFKNLQSASHMFRSCQGLNIKIEKLTLQNVGDASCMFYAADIESIKEINMPHASTVRSIFSATDVKTIGKITAAAEDCADMFYACKELTQIMHLQLDNAKDVEAICYNTPKLASIPFLMINPNVDNAYNAFCASMLEPVYGADMQIYIVVMKNLKGLK